MPPTIDTTAMRKVTPIITPSRVKKLLSFCTQICCSARRMASKKGMTESYSLTRRRAGRPDGRPWSGRDAELLDEGRAALVGRNEAVAKHDDATRVLGDVRFVRHHDHRLPLVGEALEHPHDLLGGRGVEVAGGLVGEEDGRVVDERAGDG